MKSVQTGINTIEHWKSALMTMPDTSFFELLRSVFGKIKSPFNKQKLLKELESFLIKEEIQKTISEYISSSDEKIIKAISLYGNPAIGELERFFNKDDFSNIQLHDNIINLEERFIIYRYLDNEKKSRLALNPVLKKILEPITKNVSDLFQHKENPKTNKLKKNAIKIDDRILAAIFSFVCERDSVIFFKKEGKMKKQIIDDGKICFPGLDLEEIISSLQILGLFYAENDFLKTDTNRFNDFASLTAQERAAYYAAGFLIYKEILTPPNEIQAPYFKNRVREAVNFIHTLSDAVKNLNIFTEKENNIPEQLIIKLTEVLKSKTGYNVNNNHLLDALNTTRFNTSLLTAPCSLLPAASITIDSASSIFMYPGIDFKDAIEIASFLNAKETGSIIRFELEKDSVVRAFNNGISAQDIIDILKRLSGKELPETLIYTLKEWKNRYEDVSIKKGIVLTLSKDKQYLIQTHPLSDLIIETLAPGVYLISEDSEEETESALKTAGIDIIARKKIAHKHSYQKQNYYPSPAVTKHFIPKFNIELYKSNELKEKNNSELKNKFHEILNKMKLEKTIQDELSARIERNLILSEDQLKDADIRYEKLEARHMDYAGKQIIAKQAIQHGSHIEVEFNGKKVYGIPKTLEKDGTGLNVVLTLPETGETISLPLAKISLLRRIKKSIFEG